MPPLRAHNVFLVASRFSDCVLKFLSSPYLTPRTKHTRKGPSLVQRRGLWENDGTPERVPHSRPRCPHRATRQSSETVSRQACGNRDPPSLTSFRQREVILNHRSPGLLIPSLQLILLGRSLDFGTRISHGMDHFIERQEGPVTDSSLPGDHKKLGGGNHCPGLHEQRGTRPH